MTKSLKYTILLLFFLKVSSSCFSQELIQETEDFSSVKVPDLPHNWQCKGDGWGTFSTLEIDFPRDFPNVIKKHMTSRAAHSGSKMLYCAANNKTRYVQYMDLHTKISYDKNINTYIYSAWYNENGKFKNTKRFDLSFYYMIPSIKKNDFFVVYFESKNGQITELFSTEKKTKGWMHSSVLNLAEYITENPFRIGFRFVSDAEKSGEGVYIDDIQLQYFEAPNIQIENISNNSIWLAGELNKLQWNSNYEGYVNIWIKFGSNGTKEVLYDIPTHTGINKIDIDIPLDYGTKNMDYFLEIIDSKNSSIKTSSNYFKILSKPKIVLSSKSTGWIDNSGDFPDVLDFGIVRIGESVEKEFIIKNEGEVSGTIKHLIYRNGDECEDCFRLLNIYSSDFELHPGESKTLKIRYSPKETTKEFSNATFHCGKDVVKILFKGKGKLASDIRILQETDDYGIVNIGESKIIEYVVRNYGDEQRDINIKLLGSNAFSLKNIGSSKKVTLKPFSDRKPNADLDDFLRDIKIEFEPSHSGEFKASIVYEANKRVLSVPLIGYGKVQSAENIVSSINNHPVYQPLEEKSKFEATINYPNHLTVLKQGQFIDMSWEFKSEGSIIIDLFNGEDKVQNIGMVLSNKSSCNYFEVPNDLSTGNQFRIRLSDFKNTGNITYSEMFSVISNNNDDQTGSYKTSTKRLRETFAGRRISYIDNLSFNTEDITVYVYDHEKVDNDIISIYLNGLPVTKGFSLTKQKHAFNITINPDEANELILFSMNEGTLPTNTVAVIITDGTSDEEFVLKSTMGSCEGVVLWLKE